VVKEFVTAGCVHCMWQVNTINREVLSEFREIYGKIQSDPKVRAVVISSSKPDCFLAGADVACVFLVIDMFE